MFKTHCFVLAALVAVGSTGAFAGGDNHPVSTINFETFKGRCLDNSKYPDQRSPNEIKVQCTDTVHEFIQDQAGTVAMPSTREVATSFSSDKFRVDPLVKSLAVESDAGTCVRYKEVIRTFTLEKALTCADVVGAKGDIQDYCVEYLNSFKGGKWGKGKGNVAEAATGRMIDTCAAGGITGKMFE